MSNSTPNKKAPIPVPKWDKADAYALQALEKGTATPDQQQRALMWIVNQACATYDFCDNPESDRLSAVFDGRRFAGLQIVKLIKLNVSSLNPKTEER